MHFTFFPKVIEIYRTTDSGEEKRQCLSAIGKAKDSALLSEAMDFILDSGEVTTGAVAAVLCSVSKRTITHQGCGACALPSPALRIQLWVVVILYHPYMSC